MSSEFNLKDSYFNDYEKLVNVTKNLKVFSIFYIRSDDIYVSNSTF